MRAFLQLGFRKAGSSVHRAGVETAQGGPGSWVPTGAPGGEGTEEAPLGAVQEGGGAATASQAEAVAAAATAVGSSSSSAASCSGVNGMVAGTSSQHVALADLPTADQLKAMGLCDTLIILSDTGQGAQPVSLVSSLEPIQCLDGTAEAVARSGANLVLCLPDESLSLEVGTSVQEVPGWTWLFATGEAAALVRHSAPIVVSGTPTLATAPGGEMLLVMDSSPVEDSVGLAAKSWFNDSVIATQALLTLEGHNDYSDMSDVGGWEHSSHREHTAERHHHPVTRVLMVSRTHHLNLSFASCPRWSSPSNMTRQLLPQLSQIFANLHRCRH
ncbi:hypothetical protein HPB49_018898 [Dermacentor silvarum]|uniref:Uncharacterized protein n=1 Tax=Dermacentor silvarum TaxID=543639 RepID=A0ACB8D7H8_DERSI|nr:hypothetical protein HPB49_018898 [Dermacentor silvarum]